MSNNQRTEQTTSSFQWLYPLLVAMVVATLVKLSLTQLTPVDWQSSYSWGLYFGCYSLAIVIFRQRQNNSKNQLSKHPSYSWPMPGLKGRLGIGVKTIVFVLSNLLSLLNPFLLFQQIRLTFGMICISYRIRGHEEYIKNYEVKARYRLPFNGGWLIYHGGTTPETSHSWNVLNQRYAYDFVVSDNTYKRHTGAGFHVSDYKCYGKNILSAADGEVIKVVNGVKDSPFIGWFFINAMSKQAAGNHLIIKHEEGEYGFYAHLIKDSIPLKVGDKVIAGQFIGKCGFSGSTTEPHLHFHLQDTPSFYSSVGLPLKFENIAIDCVKVDKSTIQRGTVVNNVIESTQT
jgi:murein DD-endopeptidase MepM/ murein hydrolase activator NlpD